MSSQISPSERVITGEGERNDKPLLPFSQGGRVRSVSNGISAPLVCRGRATEANMTGSVPVESKVTVKRITVHWENSSSFLYLLLAKI